MRNDLAQDRGNNNIERVNILFNGVAKTFRFRDILGLRALSDGKVDDKMLFDGGKASYLYIIL